MVFCILFDANCQSLDDESIFLNTFFKDYVKVDGKIYYKIGVDSMIRQTTLQNVLSGELKDRIKSKSNNKINNRVSLDSNEVVELARKISDMENFPLKQRPLRNSKRLKSRLKDSSLPNVYFVLSRPIFFRNNSMCIIIYEQHCGDRYGSAASLVFMNVSGKWTRLFLLDSWVS